VLSTLIAAVVPVLLIAARPDLVAATLVFSAVGSLATLPALLSLLL
jgi:hypothetical protein